MKKFMYDSCLKWKSSRAAPDDDSYIEEEVVVEKEEEDHDSGILADVATLCYLVRFALFFQPRRSLRQPLPTPGQLAFPPKLLRRFLRGCVVATAHRLVTAPASVFVDARKRIILRNHIFARVMSGFVMREEVRLQAAAAARIAGKSGIIAAAARVDVADVLSYLIEDANCVNESD